MSLSKENLIKNNKKWVNEILKKNPNYFKNLIKGQKPHHLIISCSDSRVPIEVFTKAAPGDIFIHRNIANILDESDTNFMSVLEYAIEHLKIKNIIVIGHYHCGGLEAAYKNYKKGNIGKWLYSTKKLINKNQNKINTHKGLENKLNFISEISLQDQIEKLNNFKIIKKAKINGTAPEINGWIYDMKNGLLKEFH